MKIPAQYLTLYMLLIMGFLMICIFAAAFRKKIILTVLLTLILAGGAFLLIYGKSHVAYVRAPEGDKTLLEIVIKDDGIYYEGKKLNVIEKKYDTGKSGLEAYKTKYTLPVLNMFETEDGYVYFLNMS